ncbi:DUF7706 family protein [Pseudomonas putida]|uniref:DUF7706 family protein n=1 Tax=Pseudomonas putida TaxID=303 RepID=UPI003FA13717
MSSSLCASGIWKRQSTVYLSSRLFCGCAIDHDEAYSIQAAVGKVQDALARSGYNPR